jgi:phosphate transport system substrate-binding protein
VATSAAIALDASLPAYQAVSGMSGQRHLRFSKALRNPMSRPMSADELGAFEKKYGYKPAHFRVAVDALAIYVNKDNPIPCLTLQRLDQIFSATRQGSGSRSIDTWGGVGMTGEWATKPISICGRNALSETYEFFKPTVLYNGEYKEGVKQQPDSQAG